MSFQTNYDRRPASGYHGMIADMQDVETVSRPVEETDGIMPGLGVTLVDPAATQLTIKIPTADTETFQGIVRQEDYEPINEITGEMVIKNKQIAGVVTTGLIHAVALDEAYQYGQKAYVVSSGANAGKFTAIATNNIDSGGIFVSKETADRAIVQLNNPQK